MNVCVGPRAKLSSPHPCPSVPALSTRLARSAFAGLVVWGGLLFVPLAVDAGPMEAAAHLVLLAPLVLVPLLLDAAVPFSFSDRPSWLLTVASWGLLPSALAVGGAFLVPTGVLAGALVVPWGAVTALVAVWALRRAWGLYGTGRLDAAEAVLTAGLAMLPGGALWLFWARAGVDPGPYGSLVVLLTAAHFHYAAFAVPVWSGLLGRTLADAAPNLRRVHAVLGGGVVVGFWFVAVGIALSRGPAGTSLIETSGVLLLTLSAIGQGGLGLAVAPRLGQRWDGLMVGVSGGALALAMGLALWFNLGPRLGGGPAVAWMLTHHGWLNAIGFGLWGALGWRRLRPRPAGA